MSRDDDPQHPTDREADEDAPSLDLIGEALARKGELPPTTVAEVQAAEEAGVAFEGELPAGLQHFEEGAERRGPRGAERTHVGGGAASQRVVSLEELRRQREKQRSRPSWASHATTFALGAAAAAALLLTTRDGPPTSGLDPAAGVPSAIPSSSASAPAAPVELPSVNGCADDCCAGAACSAAKGELRKCLGGKACIGCSDAPPPGSAYRVRLGNLVPAAMADAEALRAFDLCARVGASSWSCEPAIADAVTRPEGRTLPSVASAADLSASIELELRPKGKRLVAGRWRDAVRIGPTVLCRGLGALIATEAGKDLGSVAIALEDTHFVELARGADLPSLKALRATMAFADVIPQLQETTLPGAERFALAVGPLDKVTAERLRWALLERKLEARVSLGADYVGAPKALP